MDVHFYEHADRMTIEDKIDEILRNHGSWKKAHRRGDRKRVQKLRDRFEQLAGELMKTAEGRAALEELLKKSLVAIALCRQYGRHRMGPRKGDPCLGPVAL